MCVCVCRERERRGSGRARRVEGEKGGKVRNVMAEFFLFWSWCGGRNHHSVHGSASLALEANPSHGWRRVRICGWAFIHGLWC